MISGLRDAQGRLEDSVDYCEMDGGQLANSLAPYGQTDLLISEAVNVKTEINNDQIKLEAPRGGHRDRAVTCAMGLLIFDYIENEWQRQDQQDDFDVDSLQLVW